MNQESMSLNDIPFQFVSPYDQYKEHNGKTARIVRPLTDEERDPEVGNMYRIRFEDGTEIDAWPEELTLRMEVATD